MIKVFMGDDQNVNFKDMRVPWGSTGPPRGAWTDVAPQPSFIFYTMLRNIGIHFKRCLQSLKSICIL